MSALVAESTTRTVAIFIVLVGTLAQVDKDMWEVIDDYFRTWIAWIHDRPAETVRRLDHRT